MLDGWDNQEPTSQKKREDFRRFLVDAHKASYVPVCIAGSDEIMTAEPAVVIHNDNDEGDPSTFLPSAPRETSRDSLARSQSSQIGVAMRRVTPRGLERSQAIRHLDLNGSGSGSYSLSTLGQSIVEDQDAECKLQEVKTNGL
jgi:hypothetical protein